MPDLPGLQLAPVTLIPLLDFRIRTHRRDGQRIDVLMAFRVLCTVSPER